jgi:periplasmic divalent cation tolerance protein
MGEIIVLITTGNEDDAERIAKTLVEEQLAACVNIAPSIRSIYRWQGKIQDDSEALMIVKTKQSVFEALVKRVEALHRYEVPEIIAFPIAMGSEKYLKWLNESVQQRFSRL